MREDELSFLTRQLSEFRESMLREEDAISGELREVREEHRDGRYIVEAVRALDDILRRMEGHQQKTRSALRKLRLAELFQQHSDQNNRASAA